MIVCCAGCASRTLHTRSIIAVPHLHLVEAREVQQDREAGEQLQALGEGAEDGEGEGDVLFRVAGEGLHIIVLVLHLLVAEESGILRLGHADGVQQVRVGGDVDGFHVGEGRQHHHHLGRLEQPSVVLHVAVVHLDVGLGEEAEDLGEQITFRDRQIAVPVLNVVGQRHLFRQPVDALLGQPGLVGPGIVERLVDVIGFEQGQRGPPKL